MFFKGNKKVKYVVLVIKNKFLRDEIIVYRRTLSFFSIHPSILYI